MIHLLRGMVALETTIIFMVMLNDMKLKRSTRLHLYVGLAKDELSAWNDQHVEGGERCC